MKVFAFEVLQGLRSNLFRTNGKRNSYNHICLINKIY